MAIITSPADTGNGGGFSAAQGAINPTTASGTCIVTNMTTRFMIRDNFDSGGVDYHPNTHATGNSASSHGVGYNLFAANTGSNNFSMHTGHTNNSSHWPMYFAIHLTDHFRGMIVNRCHWNKHSNACGNVDWWGTMDNIGDHMGSSWYNTANYTNLGRTHFGGSGSGNERTLITQSFNGSSFGYRWILMIIQDTNTSALSYPSVGTRQGWAMYGMQIGKS